MVWKNYLILIAVVALMTPIILLMYRFIALKVGLVDVPNNRKIHSNAIPLVGGIALFSVSAMLLLMIPNISQFHQFLFFASALVMLIGLLDDVFQLSALIRFIVQIGASLLIIYFANVQLTSFGYLLLSASELNLGILSIPITVFGVVGIINSLNMLDGIDGLAAMTFFLPVSLMVFLSNDVSLALWLGLLLLSILIFVAFNKSQKFKVFLGDNGSLLLGFILAWLLVYFSQGQQAIFKPVSALYLVGIPVFDTIFVMTGRILSGQSPFKPDNTHLHHYFLKLGFSQTTTLFVVLLLQASMILLGFMFLKLSIAEYIQFYGFVFMSILYYIVMKNLWKKVQQNEINTK